MATVTALGTDPAGRPVAKVEGPDGVGWDLYPQSGWLPAPGDTVTLVANGADPLGQAVRRLVEGTLETGADGYDIYADKGVGIDSDGNLYANNAYIRGLIEASVINASEINGSVITAALVRSAVSGVRLEIDDDGEIRWYTGNPAEVYPPHVEFLASGVRINGPSQSGGPPPMITLARDWIDNRALASVVADDVAVSADDGALSLDGNGGVYIYSHSGAISIGGRVYKPVAAGRFSGTTDVNGDVTIAHGMGVVCRMTLQMTTAMAEFDFSGHNPTIFLQASSTSGNRYRLYYGPNVSASGVTVEVDWIAAPA